MSAHQASCLYVGELSHQRVEPPRAFHHKVTMFYVDLSELGDLLDGRLLRPGLGLVRFRRSDYHGDRAADLADGVRTAVERQVGIRPVGPIRLLTTLRSLGLCFNPVSFYYCFDRAGQQLEAVLVEVTNTPWGEREAYVVAGSTGHFQKRMHVSPFMPMDQSYRINLGVPSHRLSVTIQNRRDARREFFARLQLRRVELTPATVRDAVLRHPPAAIRTLALIYCHALALRIAGVRTFPHPQRGTP